MKESRLRRLFNTLSAALSACRRWLRWGIRTLLLVFAVTWGTLALYYSNLPWAGGRIVLAIAFFAFSVWALWFQRGRGYRWGFGAVMTMVVIWFILIRPSHDRPWRPEVAVMPRATINGDDVTFTGIRNFDFRTRDDFTIRYEERTVQLSHLVAIDFFVSYWKIGPVGHTFVSFIFDNAPPICISIETRPEIGEGFAPIASMFKQFELINVVGEERDIIGLRTNHRDEDVYLYRLRVPPESMRLLFLVYIDRINQLADQAEFYHLLKNSCTINIVRYANASGRRGGFDFRHLLNGFIDRYLYAAGYLDTSLPFEELRRRSCITAKGPAAAASEDFSATIREGLPGMSLIEPPPTKLPR